MKVTRLPGTAVAANASGPAATSSTSFSTVLDRSHEPLANVTAAEPTGASIVKRAIARAAQAANPQAARDAEEKEAVEAAMKGLSSGSKISGAASLEGADYEDPEGDE